MLMHYAGMAVGFIVVGVASGSYGQIRDMQSCVGELPIEPFSG